MKVTKAKGLNATPLSAFFARRPSAQRATWRPCCEPGQHHARRRGPRKASPALIQRSAARPLPLDPGPTRSEAPPSALSPGVAAERPSGPLGAVPQHAERKDRCCIQGLCFGDFHLALQMKVTRPPGRDPAGNAARSGPKKQDKSNAPGGPRGASRCGAIKRDPTSAATAAARHPTPAPRSRPSPGSRDRHASAATPGASRPPGG